MEKKLGLMARLRINAIHVFFAVFMLRWITPPFGMGMVVDSTFPPGRVYLSMDGKAIVLQSGTKVQVESGGQMDLTEMASAQTVAGNDGMIEVDIPNSAGTIAIVLSQTYKLRLIDATFIKDPVSAGGAGDTIDIKNGATAITNQIAASGAVKTIARITTLDFGQSDLAVGATLNIVVAKVTNPSGKLFLTFNRVP